MQGITKPTPNREVRAFLAQPHKMLIGGKWVEAEDGATIPVEDPATKEIIAHVPAATRGDVDRAVKAARKAFTDGPWARTLSAERSRLIWRLSDLIEQNFDELAQLESLDNGKPLANCRAVDIPETISMLRFAAGAATRINGETVPVSTEGEWHAYTEREPVGVVAQIVPWNHPLLMASWKIAPALAAGCTIVLKPSEQTPLTALRLGELILEAGFPEGVINIVTGLGETAGAALAAHPDVDKIAFTGSTEVGKLIVKAATGNLKRVSLELGGKSPMFIFPDADIDAAIAGAAGAIFRDQGQVCTAASRLYAHKSIFERVVEGVAAEADKLKLGHGLDPTVTLGPLVSSKQKQRVDQYIEIGKTEGAEVLTSTTPPHEDGHFVNPTVLARTNRNMRVVREEIFGPVVCVEPFDSDNFDDIARIANDTEFGLSASIWTSNLRTAHLMARKIKAGGVGINVHNYANPALPFGGFKQSGWGREMGKEMMGLYTEIKSIIVKL